MMYAVETRNLCKHFGKLAAVDHLNLRIRVGETYGLLGPNGSGKTTTIKMLCGLLRPSAGAARFMGRYRPGKSVMARVGYMPQDTAIYLENTVHENIMLFGRIYGVPPKKLREREDALLDFVYLKNRRNTLASKLSGGMRHRLSLACAIVHDPDILFLDEPTVGVDPELREAFWRYFSELSKSGKTIVITTHYMDEASHCDRIGLMRTGRLIAEGTPVGIKRMTGKQNLEDAFLMLAKRTGAVGGNNRYASNGQDARTEPSGEGYAGGGANGN